MVDKYIKKTIGLYQAYKLWHIHFIFIMLYRYFLKNHQPYESTIYFCILQIGLIIAFVSQIKSINLNKIDWLINTPITDVKYQKINRMTGCSSSAKEWYDLTVKNGDGLKTIDYQIIKELSKFD